MHSYKRNLTVVISLLLALPAAAQPDRMKGERKYFTSPNGLREECIILDRFPEADYSKKDSEKENEYCALDFYDNRLILCPKTWSTSPGTNVYALDLTVFTGGSSHEASLCQKKKTLSDVDGVDSLVRFKQSANGNKSFSTTATYSMASVLYYHFSRYFETTLTVPTAVVRTMDKQVHLSRVVKPGTRLATSTWINNAWRYYEQVEQNPSLHPRKELFFTDESFTQIYGSMVKGRGDRYPEKDQPGNMEFIGSNSGGYTAANQSMMKTAPATALKTEGTLAQAVQAAKRIVSYVPDVQIVYWMKEMSEMLILDYIFGQQDRTGNIDFLWYWVWVDENGKVKDKRTKAVKSWKDSEKVPEELARYSPVLIKKTQLNDNDAGGLPKYTNFTKKLGMLETVRHIGPVTYRKLIGLARNLQDSNSEIYRHLSESMGLPADVVKQTVQNAVAAAEILRKTCEVGKLRFDLDPEAYLKALSSGQPLPEAVTLDCQTGEVRSR